MNKRIRYISGIYDTQGSVVVDGFVGSKYYKSKDNVEYQVKYQQILGLSECEGVVTLTDGSIVKTFRETSPHKIKIALKQALIDLGCEFESEKRETNETD